MNESTINSSTFDSYMDNEISIQMKNIKNLYHVEEIFHIMF